MGALRHVPPSLTILVVTLSSACASSQTGVAPAERSTVAIADHDPSEPIEKVLQRRFPGLRVTRTSDGTLAFQIRGSSAYNNRATPPLYVLDGVPFKPGPDGALVGIDPNEIDTVKVLTSAESGLYGIEGANGVILITTRRPPKREP